jgi:hypothetical protein
MMKDLCHCITSGSNSRDVHLNACLSASVGNRVTGDGQEEQCNHRFETASLGTDKKSRATTVSLPFMLVMVVSELLMHIHLLTYFMPVSPLGLILGRPTSQPLLWGALCRQQEGWRKSRGLCSLLSVPSLSLISNATGFSKFLLRILFFCTKINQKRKTYMCRLIF